MSEELATFLNPQVSHHMALGDLMIQYSSFSSLLVTWEDDGHCSYRQNESLPTAERCRVSRLHMASPWLQVPKGLQDRFRVRCTLFPWSCGIAGDPGHCDCRKRCNSPLT